MKSIRQTSPLAPIAIFAVGLTVYIKEGQHRAAIGVLLVLNLVTIALGIFIHKNKDN